MTTTLGQLLVNEALPEDLRESRHDLDKKSIHHLMNRLAERHPERYRETLKHLSDIGLEAGWGSGASVSLAHLGPSRAKAQYLAPVRTRIQQILNDHRLDDRTRNQQIIEAVLPHSEGLTRAVLEEARQERSPFHTQVASGGRGKAGDLNSLKGADLLATDAKNQLIPIPVLNNYSEGLTPAEWFASTFAQRRGAAEVKLATADAGFFGKKVANAAHRQVVTRERPDETRLPVGLPVSAQDPDNIGSVLAAPAGPYRAGEIITPQVQQALKDQGVEDILLHSPLTELTPDGGLSRWAAGKRDRHGLARIGDNIGITSAQTVSEKLSQGALHCLVAGTLVRMADWSVKPIEAIQVGEQVLGADREGRTFPVKVNHTFDNGVQPVRRYRFKVGSTREMIEIVATENHKVLCNVKKWSTPAQTLNGTLQVLPLGTVGRDFSGIRPAGFTATGLTYEPRAALLGALLGDGCFTEAVHGVYLSSADPLLVEHLGASLAAAGAEAVLHSTKKIYYRIRGQRSPSAARVADPVAPWLRQLGVYGKYAHEKVIPAECYSWDNQSIAALLGGLFATDGSVCRLGRSGVRLSFTSSSHRLVEQVRELLDWRFGIAATAITTDSARVSPVAKEDREYGIFYANHPMHSITINTAVAVGRFAQSISLIGVKRSRLADMLAGADMPVPSPWRPCPRQRDAAALGDAQVYDIEVDHPDHLFVLANGLIVSNSKHASLLGNRRMARAGQQYLNRLLDGSENFPEAGPLARLDGRVEEVRKAPQGGWEIRIGDQTHYAHEGVEPTVKPGDQVEAGDDLTDGVPHPRDLVQYRGLGEARRVYTQVLGEALRESGVPVGRRTIESNVAGLLNWARVTDPDGLGDAVVDDIVPANRLIHQYQARPDAKLSSPQLALGQYLEEPALHYTPGTRVTRKVAKELEKWKIKDVRVHHEAPGFEPHMERSVLSTYHDPDWQVRIQGFYTSDAFLDSLHRGGESDANSTSFIPALARGVGFGESLGTRGTYGSSKPLAPGRPPGPVLAPTIPVRAPMDPAPMDPSPDTSPLNPLPA